MYFQRALSLLLVFAFGCADDLSRGPIPEDQRWPEAPEQLSVAEPVTYEERQGDTPYGLPTASASAIGDLIDLVAARAPERFSDPRTFTSLEGRFPCPGGGVEVLPGLPVTIEGVITLHPRQYVKVPVCDQDEKHYGTFTIEDDTGGIMVLRDSRIAPFTAGDRVRMRINAVTYTYIDPTTRTVLSADMELMDPPGADRERVVYYERQTTPFSIADITQTKRIIGYVAQPPSNKNFSTMIIADKKFWDDSDAAEQDNAQAPSEETDRSSRICMANCMGQCGCGFSVCQDRICPSFCRGPNPEFDPAKMPMCWETSLDQEMVRRGLTYDTRTKVSVTGPVVDSYGLKIWIQRLGQVEVLQND